MPVLFVLGFSWLIWARFVLHQDMQTVLRCHLAAFEAIGDVPHEILYDCMKTIIGEAGGGIVYNRALINFARHYSFQPRACRPYGAKTKRKVERPYRYIREDFFLARSFRNLDDLNVQLRRCSMRSPIRACTTTQRVVNEAVAEQKLHLKMLPLAPFCSVLKLERRVSHEGMVSVGGSLYSVPDATRKGRRSAHPLRRGPAFKDGALIAAHPVLEGRHQRRVAAGYRQVPRIVDPRHDKPIDHLNQQNRMKIANAFGAASQSIEFHASTTRWQKQGGILIAQTAL